MMYGTIEIIKALEDAHIRASIPIAERGQRAGYYGSAQFTYDAVHDLYSCPEAASLAPSVSNGSNAADPISRRCSHAVLRAL